MLRTQLAQGDLHVACRCSARFVSFGGLAVAQFHRKRTMADFAGLEAGLAKRDLVNGRRVLKAAACLACHRFGDEGLFAGPDLTAVGARFDARAMLESILEPSRVIDDKYRNVAITTKQGELIAGRLVAERDKSLLLASNPYHPTFTREIQRSTIATRNDSGFSPMPVGLLNSFGREDVLDLLAVLRKGMPPARGE